MQRKGNFRFRMRGAVVCLTATIFAVALAATPARAAVTHPLDALETAEYAKVIQILKAAKRIDGDSRFALVTLQDPDKALVLKWQTGQPIPRAAFVIVKNGKKTFDGVVDISGNKVASWHERKGVQPGVLFDEFFGVQDIVFKDKGWQAAMGKRGVTAFPKGRYFCAPLTAGYLGIRGNRGRRILNVQCFDEGGMKTNMFGRPIEGLTAVVDLDARKVIRIVDTGAVPISKDSANYDEGSVGKLQPQMKPVLITQPDGVNFTINGGMVTWRNWSFHLRFDRRVGTVLSLVRFQDKGRARSILYRASLSEVFVPYMDPSYGWRFKSYMDAGEYGFGLLASPLVAGSDCPANARYLGGLVALDAGKPEPYKGVVCIFERNTGEPAWRHAEILNETRESRPRIDLVVRMIATVGNYDYKLDWVFAQWGMMRVEMGATGIDIPKGVKSKSMSDRTAKSDTTYGTLVAPNIVLPNHDHFFSFRLDFDVDGPKNSFVRGQLQTVRLPKKNLRRSLWRVVPRVAKREKDAILTMNIRRPEIWRIVSTTAKNAVGSPTSYVLKPVGGAISLLSSNDWPQRRAAFSKNQLWVTPYRADELYAAGTYPNQSKGDQGLAVWTRKNRRIENTDIVVWYTLGFHHVTASEDWPVLPMMAESKSFVIRPFNFFDRNPIINLPAKLMADKRAEKAKDGQKGATTDPKAAAKQGTKKKKSK